MASEPLNFIRKASYLRIRPDRVIRLRYAVFDLDGDRAIEFRDDLYYLHCGYGGAFPKVEAALDGRQVGDSVEVILSPEEGYGPRAPELELTVEEEAIPAEARRVGARIEGEAPDGHTINFTVTGIQAGRVTVDGNHPLAGRSLRFVFEVLDVRVARSEEIQAGFAFAPETGHPSRSSG
jgi:FKBP-type peptidyl-prolyl cis-trans isomerase SlyD